MTISKNNPEENLNQKLQIVAKFEIPYYQFLNKDGKINQDLQEKLPEFAKSKDYLIKLYTAMLRTRVFDTKAIALQRTGKMGTYPSVLGQEAIGVAMAASMQEQDVLCPYYREQGGQLWRGVSMSEILLYWGGDERGSAFQNKSVKEDFPICVPIGSQTLHAVGIAMAFKLKKEARVAVVAVGDGGTSRGDFYEAMNMAGVWKLPVVFVINNNQWAISVARKDQTAAETLCQKGIAAGIDSLQVDGNDVIALREIIGDAVARARKGEGPSVIEALTYRLSDHTTADDAKRYRAEEELSENRLKDPVKRLYQYLCSLGVWDETRDKDLQKTAMEEVNQSVEAYVNMQPKKPESMFDHLYAKLPHAYTAEREEVKTISISKTGHHG